MLGSSRFVEVLDGATEPVTRSRVKEQLNVDHTADDLLIESLISGVRAEIESHLFTALIKQTRVANFDDFGNLTLMGPHLGITSVIYLDSDGASQTLAADQYRVVQDVVTYLRPVTTWPTTLCETGAVQVTYTCGPGTISPVIINAMLLKITDQYDNRANPVRMKTTLADNILANERVQIFG